MDQTTKITFSLSIGYVGAEREEKFTLAQLGYSPDVHTDLEAFLDECWYNWTQNYIDGTWKLDE